MTPWQTVVAHATVAVIIIAALAVLAVKGTIPGSDAFTGIMAVAVGSGVIAGASLSGTSTTTTTADSTAVTKGAGQA